MRYERAWTSWFLFNGSDCFTPPFMMMLLLLLLLWIEEEVVVANIAGVMRSFVPLGVGCGKKPGGAVLFALTRIGWWPFPFSWLISFFRPALTLLAFKNWANGEFARSLLGFWLGIKLLLFWVSSKSQNYN